MHLIFSRILLDMSTWRALRPLEVLEVTMERRESKGKLHQPLNFPGSLTSVICSLNIHAQSPGHIENIKYPNMQGHDT